VELELRPHGARGALRRADRAAIPLLALVGERELADQVFVVRDMREREERRVPLSELVSSLREAL
jgi:histidyl-tRNA synthetase